MNTTRQNVSSFYYFYFSFAFTGKALLRCAA